MFIYVYVRIYYAILISIIRNNLAEENPTLLALFENMPVIAVQDWSLVTPKYLNQQYSVLSTTASTGTSASTLSSSYTHHPAISSDVIIADSLAY